MGGTLTTASSGMTSHSERRHIHFNNEVGQCIAVDIKNGDEEQWPATIKDESTSDDGVVMMRQISVKSCLSKLSTPRNRFSSDSKTIAPLPSTTLKYWADTPEPKGGCILDRLSALPHFSSSSPTPSVETLRPRSQFVNFLLDDGEDPSLDFASHSSNEDRGWLVPEDANELGARSMQLTGSDMFIPYGESGGESVSNGLLGRVVDTFNTARNIAHVI